MGDGFTPVPAVVDHDTVAVFLKSQGTCRRGGRTQKLAEEQAILLLRLVQSRDAVFRNDKNVNGSLRCDVTERDPIFSFCDNVRRNLPSRDLFKEGHAHVR